MSPPEHSVELQGVPLSENSVELPGVDSPENKVDDYVVSPLLPSDYEINNDSDNKDKDIETPTQQYQRVINPDAMPPMARNAYNLFPRKQTDYLKESIYQLNLLTEFGNGLNKYALLFLNHEGMEHY